MLDKCLVGPPGPEDEAVRAQTRQPNVLAADSDTWAGAVRVRGRGGAGVLRVARCDRPV